MHRREVDARASVARLAQGAILPQLDEPGFGLSTLAWALLKAVVFLAARVILGTRLFPKVLAIVARAESRELFLLAVTALGRTPGFHPSLGRQVAAAAQIGQWFSIRT